MKQKQSGFTLVELLVVMGLLTGFLLVLTDIAVATLDVQNESAATSAITQDGRFILARLSYDIQRADSVTTPASAGSTSPNLVLVVEGVTYTYALSGNNLQLTNALGTNIVNSPNSTVSGLSLQRIGTTQDTVRLTFTVTSVARDDQGQRTQTFTTTVGRRL